VTEPVPPEKPTLFWVNSAPGGADTEKEADGDVSRN